MSKRKVPATSAAANDSVAEMKEMHCAKILACLEKYGELSAEQLAGKLLMQHVQVNRRMSELQKEAKIYRTGNRVSTSTGRSAYTWRILGEGEEVPEVTERFQKGVEKSTDFAKKLIRTNDNY